MADEEETIDFTLGNFEFEDVDLEQVAVYPHSCLVMNQAYQEQLEQFLCELEAKITENRNRQEELKEKLKKGNSSRKENSIKPFFTPYFKDARGFRPPANIDAIRKRENGEFNQNYFRPQKKWYRSDECNLVRVLSQISTKDSLEDLRREREHCLAQVTGDKVEEASRVYWEQLSQLDKQIDKLVQSKQLIFPAAECVDWLYVARFTDYDALNCELYWRNWLQPQVNKGTWTSTENDRLKELTSNSNHFNWEDIAKSLGTNRKAWQVCKQYQVTLNYAVFRLGNFTDEEKALLEKVVEICSIGDYIPWSQVKFFFNGRSQSQLRSFWKHYKRKTFLKKKQYWPLLDDITLYVAQKHFGNNWLQISFYLPNRTNRQCRSRYLNNLKTLDRVLGNWTVKEDRQLLEIAENPFSWEENTNLMPGRSSKQMKGRFYTLQKMIASGVNVIKKANRKKKVMAYQRLRNKYIEKRCENIKDVEIFLRNCRLELLKRRAPIKEILELDKKLVLSSVCVTNEKRKEQRREEEELDQEIISMIENYNLFPEKYVHLPTDMSKPDFIFEEKLRNEMARLFGEKLDQDDSLLANVLDFTIKKELINHHPNCKEYAAIFPPNRISLNGFYGLLVMKNSLEQKVITHPEEMESLDIEFLKNDQQFKKLNSCFMSVFYWPTLLTDVPLPKSNQMSIKLTTPKIKSCEKAIYRAKKRDRMKTVTKLRCIQQKLFLA